MMSTLCPAAVAVSSKSWFIKFEVLTLNTGMLSMLLHPSKFGLGFVGDFSDTGVSVQPQWNSLFVYPREEREGLDVRLELGL